MSDVDSSPAWQRDKIGDEPDLSSLLKPRDTVTATVRHAGPSPDTPRSPSISSGDLPSGLYVSVRIYSQLNVLEIEKDVFLDGSACEASLGSLIAMVKTSHGRISDVNYVDVSFQTGAQQTIRCSKSPNAKLRTYIEQRPEDFPSEMSTFVQDRECLVFTAKALTKDDDEELTDDEVLDVIVAPRLLQSHKT